MSASSTVAQVAILLIAATFDCSWRLGLSA
jgi:hypothetical protein